MTLRLALAVLVALAARPAVAQPLGEESYVSPQNFAAEVKFGPYTPNIDGEFATSPGPYARYFGNDSGLMMQYTFEYQFLRRFGALGAGLGLGYWSKSGKAFACKSGSGLSCVPDFTKTTGDDTSLQILPLSLFLVYRFDWPAEQFRFPLVPYGKFGLTYTFWWADKGNGKVSDVILASGATEHGRGAQLGLTAALGAALMLDIFDPGAGHELDSTLGINHTYLFWEWVWSGADGLGSNTALHVGASSWLAGLAFEF